MNRNRLLLGSLLLEEIEQEELVQFSYIQNLFGKRPEKELFRRRRREGAFTTLIKRHLMDNDTLFKEFFRLTREEFEEVFKTVGPSLERPGNNRRVLPITGREKLCITQSYYASLFSQPRLVPPLKRPRLMLSATTKASKLAPPGPAKGPPSGPLPAAQQKAPGSPTTDSSTIKTYSNPDILICGNCRDMFTELQDLLEHRKTHCKLRFTCKCRTTENSSATNAQLDCEREAKASLLCVQCKDSFQCAWDLMVHVQAAHMLNIYELGVPPKHNNGLEAMNNGKIPSSDLTNGEASAEEMTSSQNCDAKFISTQITSQRSPSSDSLGEPSEKNDASLLHVLTNGES
ncbi:uncharacterized protein [Bemisia tabaci]|uniref:uncharacterized protein isoform X3 n=1 Tax=Bemisia tabaci TaxID=7038 RepID=UPI003B28A69A